MPPRCVPHLPHAASLIAPTLRVYYPSWMLGIPCIALVIHGIMDAGRVRMDVCLPYHALRATCRLIQGLIHLVPLVEYYFFAEVDEFFIR